jgi:hypothetical protein
VRWSVIFRKGGRGSDCIRNGEGSGGEEVKDDDSD